MDVARFNFSHGDHSIHEARFNEVVRAREELNLPVATMIDTKGPEIRVGNLGNKPEGEEVIHLYIGDTIIFVPEDEYSKLSEEEIKTSHSLDESMEKREYIVPITYKNLSHDIICGMHILLDDGLLDCIVDNVDHNRIVCRMLNDGVLKSRKGVNIPGCELNMPFISESDEADIRFASKLGFDFVAASFVRRPQDVIDLRNLLNECGSKMKIISKIENLEGVNNFDEILKLSDGIMVARGDMGVEIPEEEVPVIQKKIIKDVYKAGKQVITATQMLESMIEHNRATRAEVNDIANAIYDGTSAIMLSGETAAGRYPVESLQTMVRIAERIESDIDYKKRFINRDMEKTPLDVTDAISHASCMTAHDLNAEAIIAVTLSGRTVRNISKFRPLCPIMGCTPDKQAYYQLNLSWGVKPLLIEEKSTEAVLIDSAARAVKEAGYLSHDGMAVVTAGVPIGKKGMTNLLRVLSGHDV